MLQGSWQKLDDGRWGVRIQGLPGSTAGKEGKEVQVRKRDHSVKTVRLGRRVTSWNGGRTSIYEVSP